MIYHICFWVDSLLVAITIEAFKQLAGSDREEGLLQPITQTMPSQQDSNFSTAAKDFFTSVLATSRVSKQVYYNKTT